MKFIHRLAYYLLGFSVGLIFLAFFLSGKEATCDYSPNARVKKNIRIKPRIFSETVLQQIQDKKIDSANISYVLYNGSVDFSESNTNLEVCNVYVITGKREDKKLRLEVENCHEQAKILSFSEEN